ncbi:MAG: CoA pyrophosphatase [Deinococcales bacterium]
MSESRLTNLDGNLSNLAKRLESYSRERLYIEGFRSAAVLVPIIQAESGLELLFTIRSAGLSSHAGQIAFPGGRVEPEESSQQAALRESFEEIALEQDSAHILGELDDHPSPARYIVTPVVAIIKPQAFIPNPDEVASTFSVPLADLAKIVPYTEDRHLWGYSRRLHFYRWQEHLIWGLTGNVVKNLLELFQEGAVERPWRID